MRWLMEPSGRRNSLIDFATSVSADNYFLLQSPP